MKYEILEYNPYLHYHKCKDEDHKIKLLDLFSDNSFPEMDDSDGVTVKKCEALVGKHIEIEHLETAIQFACGVEFVKESQSEND